MTERMRRVNELMREVIGSAISTELEDPRIGFVTVTSVETSPDLRSARVYVSVLAGGDERRQVMEALAHSAGFVRHELAPVLGLREVPEIRFALDTSIERGARVEELLRKIQSGEPIPDDDEAR